MNSILNALGLVRITALAAADERLRKADARLARLTETLEEARAEGRDWKAKAGDAERRAKSAEEQASRLEDRLEKTRADLSHQLEAARERLAEFQAMRQRLRDGAQELAVARDHLMAIEVKLDILEGAANALDARTRTVAVAAGRDGDAPV